MHKLLALALLVTHLPLAWADIPNSLRVQGALQNAGGGVSDGTYAATFALYAAADAPDALWSEPLALVVSAGRFSVALGAVIPIPAALFDAASPLFLGIRVEEEPELPRQPLASVAYALAARHAVFAETAGNLQCSACISSSALSFEFVSPDDLAVALATVPAPLASVDGLGGGTLTSGLTVPTLTVGGQGSFGGAVGLGALSGPPAPCTAATVGQIYFDTALLQFRGCDGTDWLALSIAAALGQSADQAGLSCKQILDSGASKGDGIYWIDPDGLPHDNAFQTRCDMSHDGGGWTLVAYNWDKSRSFLTGTYHAVPGSLIPTPGMEAAILPASVGLQYTQIGFFIDDPQWEAPERSYTGFWAGNAAASVYDLTANTCQLLNPTDPAQWAGQLVYFAGDGDNDNGCTGGGSVFGPSGHNCDDGGGGITTNTTWPATSDDPLWGYNCVTAYSPTGAYKTSPLQNQGLHAYYVR